MKLQQEPDGSYSVTDDAGNVLSRGHSMNSAWQWIDENDPEEIEMENTRRRISYYTGQW